MKDTIVGLKLSQHTPLMLDYELHPPIKQQYIYVDYSVRRDPDFIDAKEFYYSINKMEIEEDTIGIWDEPEESEYISW